MSRRGGYKIIDLHKIPIITGTAVTIEGIYNQVKGTSKSIMISGAVVDGIEIDDFYILFENAGEHYIGIEGDNKLTVGKDETLLWEDYKPSGSVTLEAGDNIQINGDVISATDTTYSAGSGISINTDNVIKLDYETLDSKYATPDDIVKYEAGEGISIVDNVISATGGVNVDLSDYLTIEIYDKDMSALNTNINNLNTNKQDKLTAGNGISIYEDNSINVRGSTYITETNTLQIGNTWTVAHPAWSYVFSSEYILYNSFTVSAPVYYNLETKRVEFVVYKVGSGVNTADDSTAANYSYWKAFIPLFNIEVLITYNSEDNTITSTKL